MLKKEKLKEYEIKKNRGDKVGKAKKIIILNTLHKELLSSNQI